MSCSTGLHKITSKILEGKPWFSYKEGENIIRILDSPKKKINQETSKGVAISTAEKLNKIVNDGYKDIKNIYYPGFENNRGVVYIAPTNKQLDLINATDSKEIEKLQRQVDFENKKKALLDRQKEGNWDMNEEGDIVPVESDLTNELEELKRQYPELANSLEEFSKQCD